VEFVRDKESREPFDPKMKLNAVIANRAFEKGLITYPGGGGADGIRGDHILIAPPFIITEEQIDFLVAVLDESIGEITREQKLA
jgi:adenosylmethionine-8-amino-7-oxononanoate aminotransferase